MIRIHRALVVLLAVALAGRQAPSDKGTKVVEAERFVLRDAKGNVWAELAVRDGAPSLTLFDAKGQRRGGLDLLADDSVRLSLYDAMGASRTVVSVDSDGKPHLELVDKKGKVAAKKNGETEAPAKSEVSVPSPQEQKRLEAAGLVYRKLCQSCHGADGRGNNGKGKRAVPDFRDAAWQDSRPDTHLLASILDGRGDDMPPFDDRLKGDQARDLVAYIRAFSPNKRGHISTGADDFERRLLELQKQYEELERELQKLRKSE